MKKHIQRSLPAEFLAQPAYVRGMTLAAVYLFLAMTQLFTYEKFADITTDYRLPGGAVTALVVAVLLPLFEVAALPFLLSMKVSARTRHLSRAAALAAPVLWLVVAVWLVATSDTTTEAGLMGATIPIGSGLWLVAFSLLLLWSAYLVNKELPKRR